jgi:hypothetical protein
MGGELDKKQHVGAMSGSFAPLPDGDPNFLCRSVAHSIQENVVPGCRSRTRPSPHIATNLGRVELCRSPVSPLLAPAARYRTDVKDFPARVAERIARSS